MKRYRFTVAERYAVFAAHGTRKGTKCWLCDKPVNFAEMAVDHILPQYLLENKAKLTKTLCRLGLPLDFDLNSFENWAPAHDVCNRRKHNHIFRPTPIIQVRIDSSRKKAAKAREICNASANDRKIAKAIGMLATGDTALPPDLLDRIVQHYACSNSKQMQTGPKIIAPTSKDVIGFAVAAYRYVPPKEVRLAPSLRIIFHADQRPEANGPFTYAVKMQ
jgi:hypothetical protein